MADNTDDIPFMRKDYLDAEGKKLEKGFYKREGFDGLYYFTDNYRHGFPSFEREGAMHEVLLHNKVKDLIKISEDEARFELIKLKNKTNWLEEKLKE